jgi:hypothetical protein
MGVAGKVNSLVAKAGGLLNLLVASLLQISTGFKQFAVIVALFALALIAVWSLFGRYKFFPKNQSFKEVQTKEILKAIKSYKFPPPKPLAEQLHEKIPLRTFAETKVAALPYIEPSMNS